MANDPYPDPSSGGFMESSGTIPQTSAPPDVPKVQTPRATPLENVPSELEVQFHSPTFLPVNNVPSPEMAETAGAIAVSQPFLDGPTGTVIGPSNFSGPVTSFDSPARSAANDPSLGGRYTVLDELAKGGMGQVSIALDRELDRQVALKEIQPRYAYDRSVAARFLLEARVTGKLEHPGIVPVYGLNHYPDGRPYYAMRFITGESLQDAVKAFHLADKPERDPQERALAMRKLLKRFVDVCNTIAFAHSRGILHRDLKPANVMLGAFGETLVVDWGLAKDTTVVPKKPGADTTSIVPVLAFERKLPAPSPSQVPTQYPSSPLESAAFDATRTGFQVAPPTNNATPVAGYDSELTEVGKAMGTPAFMAPEQADGRWEDVGLLADIYSLGATLYAILAGKAPFRGDSHEIIERVKRGEMTPIHEHKPDVPAALVAIAKKAMALNPAERYPTALDLANDVERWMADEPIGIYREPWTVRASRWARRHRNLVLGSAAVLVTALGTITVGYFQVNEEQKRTALAKGQTEKAYDLLKGEEQKVRESYGKLQDEEKKVRTARNAAERSREEARLALLALTDDAIGEILTSQHAATGKQKLFLEHVVGLYRRFIQESADQNDSQLFVAGAQFRVGRLQFKLGNHVEADAAYRQVFELAKDQSSPEWRQLRGEAHIYSGIQQMAKGLLPEAEEQFRSARQIFFDLIVEDEKAKHAAKPEYWYRLGQSEDRLGLALYTRGNHAEAEDWFRASLENRRRLLEIQPNEPENEFRIAQSLRQIAMACNTDGRRIEALESANEARAICTRLLKADPTSAVYLVQLADIDSFLTIATSDGRLAIGDSRAAPTVRPLAKFLKEKLPPGPIAKVAARTASARHADDAVKNWSRLVNLYPADVGYRQQLAVANLNLAVSEQGAGRARAAADALAATTLVLDDLERRFPADATTTMLRGRTAHAGAVNLREKDDLESAEKMARTAIAFANQLVTDQPENPRHRNDLAFYQIELATIFMFDHKLVPAETALGEAWINTETAAKTPGIKPRDSKVWENVRGYSRAYADLLAELGRYDQVPVVAKRIESLGTWPDAARFEVACLFGRAAILATRDQKLDVVEQKKVAVELAEEALDRLGELEKGFDWLNQIRVDPDLLAVRGLAEFENAIRDFREPAPLPREK